MQKKSILVTASTRLVFLALLTLLPFAVATASERAAEPPAEDAAVETRDDASAREPASAEAGGKASLETALADEVAVELPWVSFDDLLRGEKPRLVTTAFGRCLSCNISPACNNCPICGPDGGCGISGGALCC